MNPFLKSLLTLAGAAVLPALDAAIQHPTGGLATALTSNTTYAALYVAGASVIHNLISAYFPPATK